MQLNGSCPVPPAHCHGPLKICVRCALPRQGLTKEGEKTSYILTSSLKETDAHR